MSVTALETVTGNRSRTVGGFRPQGGKPNPVPTPAPPLARSPVLFPTYPLDSPKALALRQEVETMISKGALERVPIRVPASTAASSWWKRRQEAGDP